MKLLSIDIRLRHWPFALKLTLGPMLALCAMLGLASIGMYSLSDTIQIVDGLQRSGAAGRELALASQGVQEINGTLYRVLALQAARTPTLNAPMTLEHLMTHIDLVASQLTDWRDRYASRDQAAEMDKLIAAVRNYKVAVSWVQQMLDLDFNSAVSFLQPFDDIQGRLNRDFETLVQDVAVSQSSGATEAHVSAAATRRDFIFITSAALIVVLAGGLTLIIATIRSIKDIANARSG